MYEVTKWVTEDGNEFDTMKEAGIHLNSEYCRKISSLGHQLVSIDKIEKMVWFIDENLSLFAQLNMLNDEIKECGIRKYDVTNIHPQYL